MAYQVIVTDAELVAAARRLENAEVIALDTEFVSEHTYRPQLCVIQVATPGELVVIDTLAVKNLLPFWEVLTSPGRTAIVHAGRQELLFCLEAVDRLPHDLFDVQLAAGMVGLEYPAGYGTLLVKLLSEKPKKGETRTDWRRRPLSDRQLEYALDDVRYLARLRDTLESRLASLDRLEWFRQEMADWQQEVSDSRQAERWRRVPGSASLGGRSLAVVRELWHWREREAERRNCPVRQVLRDDLIVELAKRRSDDPKQIAALRGMERGDLRRAAPQLAAVIGAALAGPEVKSIDSMRVDSTPQLMMVGQFLSSALSSICREAHVAASLVGTASEVRDLIAYRLGERDPSLGPPTLAHGWRASVVGRVLDDLLAGQIAIRIANPKAEQPLVFEPVQRS